MAPFFSMPVAAAAISLFATETSAAVFRLNRNTDSTRLESYTFAQFSHDFGRQYVAGSDDHAHREALFQAALLEVRATNVQNTKEGRLWKAGIHPFMDWATHERQVLNGYKPSRNKAHASTGLLQVGLNATRGDMFDLSDDVKSGGLTAQEGPTQRNQGNCGSCWAISAAEAIEAQLQRNGHKDVSVSPQAFVDCLPNPQHCGGSGGCDGATGELAFAFMRDYGIPLEETLPYTGTGAQCQESPLQGPYPSSTRVRVSGWHALPSNQAKPLMQALVSEGPAVVAVDGNTWFNYESGIFDSCAKDATLGHAVLAKGFGQENGHDYWLIQNSWGEEWGENGHIRLLRHADEDQWCGTDKNPKEGTGCDGGPAEITVCGTCGLLYDPLVPQGVRLEVEGQERKEMAALLGEH